ncbi:MAG: hypothetical protein K2L74_07360 [Muribaculaceae bacterium]|nr:hypothetical protein [Muribaculaceae bacterium]
MISSPITIIALVVLAAALAVGVTVAVQRRMARTRAKEIIADAEREADDIRLNR